MISLPLNKRAQPHGNPGNRFLVPSQKPHLPCQETAGRPGHDQTMRRQGQLPNPGMTTAFLVKNHRPCHDGRARRSPGPPSEPCPLTSFRPRKFASCRAGGEARFRGYLIDNVFLQRRRYFSLHAPPVKAYQSPQVANPVTFNLRSPHLTQGKEMGMNEDRVGFAGNEKRF